MDAAEGQRFLFLFAHPDDDVFIAGTMRELIVKGSDLHAVWLTSGGLLGGSGKREGELRRAMAILGLDDDRIHLGRFPDLGLVADLDRVCDFIAELVADLKPTKVFTTAFEGGHPDHDCANFAAFEGPARAAISPEICEFPLYNGSGRFYHWKWRLNSFPNAESQVLHNPLSDEVINLKYRMIRCYSSQWLYMTPARLSCYRSRMRNPGEPYRLCSNDRDHTIRPHPGTLGYERWFNAFMRIGFEEFSRAVSKARLKTK